MIGKVIDALRDQSWGPGILFVLGLCLATADGSLFPWINLVGVGILAAILWSKE